jgi:hypothetical protein
VTKNIAISILLAAFLLAMFFLSGIGVLGFSTTEILSLLLIVAGIGLAYIGLGDKVDIVVFLGTVLFLVGTLVLTNLNFEVKIENTAYIPIVLLISSVGFLMIYINSTSKKFNLLISMLLLISAFTLIFTQTKFEFGGFVGAILPLLNVYWPAIVIFLLLVILLRKDR